MENKIYILSKLNLRKTIGLAKSRYIKVVTMQLLYMYSGFGLKLPRKAASTTVFYSGILTLTDP